MGVNERLDEVMNLIGEINSFEHYMVNLAPPKALKSLWLIAIRASTVWLMTTMRKRL